MPSPFPGMDPYLESPSIWSDFHLTLIISIRAELNRRLPPHYTASADRYVWIREPENGGRTIVGKPDVYIAEERPRPAATNTQTVTAPMQVVLPGVREKGSPYLKIVDRRARRLVTVVEMLSPSNKIPGKDHEAYLMKREEYLATRVNLVELDLLRNGERPPLGTSPPTTDYYVLVCRASELPSAGVWPFSVRDPLPTIPIPLDPEDPDVMLSLRPCLDRAYDESAYERQIDYTVPAEPPLREPDATWARQLLAGLTDPNPPPS